MIGETFFVLSILAVAPFWILMILLPHWTWTKRIVGSPSIVLPIILLYIFNTLPSLAAAFTPLAAQSFAGYREVLEHPVYVISTWQHLLAFALMVGYWAYHDGYERQVARWLMTLALTTILLIGPLGLTFYIAARNFVPRESNG